MHAVFERFLDEIHARNVDNVARTESYLELYAVSRGQGTELPWLLMAHMVSRNAGYLMCDLGSALHDQRTRRTPTVTGVIENVMAMLERANFLIFYDAWHHVNVHLLGRQQQPGRTSAFMRAAWIRHQTALSRAQGAVADRTIERELVMDLVHNEQHFIERRVVHNPRFAAGLATVEMIEREGREKPMHFPIGESDIRVGGFADLTRRVATGARIFDELLADRSKRDAIYAWARTHAHTGSRQVYGGRPGPPLREVWPVPRVRQLGQSTGEDLHSPPELDPTYP
jgi:Protein of unknown function (DUF2515)